MALSRQSHSPTYRVALLPTPAFERLKVEGSAHKLVLLTAPAGYGKTALLAQWRDILRAAGTVEAPLKARRRSRGSYNGQLSEIKPG